ncbi:MAG TPA: methyltransferase domain-containing protein [Terriglobales bacterium]|jgi:ubiquinone/menaquinone biosynthesis C-methylase UbiE|nr:methyltransferase domain-containing protein [Terriglobales bacterium]
MKRRPTLELLDSDSGTPAEIEGSLRDLQSFNQRLGGVSTTRDLIHDVVRRTGKTRLSLLEVAAGTGFVPVQASRELGKSGIKLDITLSDRSPTHLPRNGSTHKVAADALSIPFSNSAFDLVSCTLFLHHLAPDEVVKFARESLRVSRIAVLVNDLVRNPLHLALAYAGVPIYRSRITRNDAPASVKQAYTIEEMSGFFRSAGAAKAEAQKHFLFRMGVIAWNSAPGGGRRDF